MAHHSLALIGLGMGATPHAQSLLDLHSRVKVAAACTRSPARAAAFSQRFGFPIQHDLAVIERDAGIDCVLIATPPNSHLELVQRFARAGKHILLEKPLEVSVEKAEALVRLCEDAKVKLAVVFQHRFRPGAIALKKLLESGGGGGGADPMAFSNHAHCAVLAEFLDAIDENREPVNSGRAALNVHYLIDAMLASARNRVPVAVKSG